MMSHEVAKEFTVGASGQGRWRQAIQQLTDVLINFKRVDKREPVGYLRLGAGACVPKRSSEADPVAHEQMPPESGLLSHCRSSFCNAKSCPPFLLSV